MTPEVEQRLADFMQRHKPDTSSGLVRFRQEIVALHFMGFSLKASFLYLVEQGASCSLRTFQRWVKENIDFTQETPPEGLGRASVAPKHPVLVDSKAGGGIDSTGRQAALVEARARREQGFKNPVDSALESRENGSKA